MNIETRLAVTAALESAGWEGGAASQLRGLLPKLTHRPSGTTLRVLTQPGGCGLDHSGGYTVTFLAQVPDSVVLAACLAASGQLDPSQDRVELEKRDNWLGCLEAAGVDNWSGMEVAIDIRRGRTN